MIAEHERLAALYLYNSDLGEKRISLYLTVISAGAAVLVGLAQFRFEMSLLLWPAIGFLIGVVVIGLLTFYRLVERRMRATEYLRAINRIHSYFVQHDPTLAPFFYWPACDDIPSFRGKGTALEALRDVVALLNSLFVGALVAVATFILLNEQFAQLDVVAGLVVATAAWFLQEGLERRILTGAERDALKFVRFPGTAGKPDYQVDNTGA
jgi:hypothetical protein